MAPARWTSRRAIALVSLALLSCARRRPRPAPPPPGPATAVAWRCPAPGPGEGARDPGALVLVHSFFGHTARVGCELAEMFGGRFVRLGDSPAPDLPATARRGAEVAATLDLRGVRRIFLGFPIWGPSEPSEPIQRLVAGLALRGIEVVPFYTHIHYADPAALERLGAMVRSRGGAWRPPLALRTPLWMSPATMLRLLHRAVLARHDLWEAQGQAQARCRTTADRPGAEVCLVPAGPVWLGDDGSEQSPDGYAPPRWTSTGAFEIDRAEVTVEQYARCVTAGHCRAGDPGSSQCARLIGDDRSLPSPCMSFRDAQAFCAWTGGRLPTEAEWVRAGRGGAVQAYPWGDAFWTEGDPPRGNFGERPGAGIPHYVLVPLDAGFPVDHAPGLSPGCAYPAGNSPFGVCDLAGNLYEWVIGDSAPQRLEVPMLKGGGWIEPDPAAFRLGARAAASLEHPQLSLGMYLTGFRCVRSIDQPAE